MFHCLSCELTPAVSRQLSSQTKKEEYKNYAGCQLWPCNAEMKWGKIISYFSFLEGRKIMSSILGRHLGIWKVAIPPWDLMHIWVTKTGKRAGIHASAVKMLKRSIELKVLPSDAREAGEKDIGQVIATRSAKESRLGCCAGSAWTPVIEPVLSPAPMRTLACSESP